MASSLSILLEVLNLIQELIFNNITKNVCAYSLPQKKKEIENSKIEENDF